jgi:hypothetical protein
VGQVSCNCPRADGDRIFSFVTERHFFAYHITGIRILITGRPLRAGIARAHAPCSRITDLITGAKQSVVGTGGIIRRVCAGIIDLVAGIHGTVNAVIAVGRCARLAGAGSGITGLGTVAELGIVAVRVNRAPGWGYTLAGLRITLLIWATLHRRKDAAGDRIAAVGGAQIPIVTDQGFTRLAIVDRIAGFDAVADIAVVAGCVIGRVDTGIIGLVAGIRGTNNPVIAVGRCARLAGAGRGITSLRTVAEKSIIAVRVNRALGLRLAFSVGRITLLTGGALHRCIGATGQWIAAVGGAQIAIVTIQRCTRLAIVDRIAGFGAVADVAVVAGCVIGRVDTGIVDLVAGIHGTDHPVIAVNIRTRLAGSGSRVTGLGTVAEKAIIAVRVNRALGLRLAYSVGRITLLTGGTLHRYIGATGQWIAAVGGAKFPIVAIQICTRLATG